MTHDELLEFTDQAHFISWQYRQYLYCLLRAVVELHKPIIHALPDETCWPCQDLYPCPTIQAIEKELG
jgi:hypothetical protein